MFSALRRVRSVMVITLLSSVAWMPFGGIIGLAGLYSITGFAGLPISAILRYALRDALLFGAWGALSGATSALALMALGRWRSRFRNLGLGRKLAYAGMGQAILLIGARVLAVRLPWHAAAVFLHEMPLPLVAVAGMTIAGTGLLMVRRAERIAVNA